MSLAQDFAPANAIPAEYLPMLVLVGAVLLFGVMGALTGNFDMGRDAAALLIGP